MVNKPLRERGGTPKRILGTEFTGLVIWRSELIHSSVGGRTVLRYTSAHARHATHR
jgi:hypothetical protein